MEGDLVLLGRALAHPARVQILRVIGGGKLSVTEVARRLGINHALVSYHLSKLYDARLVKFRKVGRSHLYRRSLDGFRCLMTPV